MKDWQSYFKDKKITVMGLGLLGRGIGDVIFLAKAGAKLIVTDLKTEKELNISLSELRKALGEKYDDIVFVLGEHRLEDFRNRDIILKAAGVPLESPYIAEARKNNITIEMGSALFAAFTEATIIGITGTKGKSTVTHLLFELLKAGYENKGRGRVFLGGNVKGISTLELLAVAKKGDIAVLELDSWQLQGFGERKISPHISIFTNFLNDHLNYYKNNIEQYFADKANIFLYQKQNDYLVAGETVAHLITAKYFGKLLNDPIAVSKDVVPRDWHIKLKGNHNLENIALAIKAVNIVGIPYEILKETVENFAGVPGRMTLVRELRGIKIYNDTNATTPDATLAALKALGEDDDKKIVLIMGGADKSLDVTQLVKSLPEFVKTLILLPGTGTSKIEPELEQLKKITLEKVSSLQEAVERAMDNAEEGDIVLFSPAFASFGMFANEYERGEQFENIVKKLE